jgi:hypothetical protein
MSMYKSKTLATFWALVLVALALILTPVAHTQTFFGQPLQGTLCRAGETVMFACSSGDKKIAVCASATKDSAFGLLRYRFGDDRSLDLEFPQKPLPLASYASGDELGDGGRGGLTYLRLRHGDTSYTVFFEAVTPTYRQTDAHEDGGVIVEARQASREAHVRCAGSRLYRHDGGPEVFRRRRATRKEGIDRLSGVSAMTITAGFHAVRPRRSPRRPLTCLLALILASPALPIAAQEASSSHGAAIWLGEYVSSAYPTRLRSGLPFSDSRDPPGPGARIAQPLSSLQPWGYLRDGKFVDVGAPLAFDAMNAYGKALMRCTGAADAQAKCRLVVANGPLGFHAAEPADADWYCGAQRIGVRDATASFQNAADGVPTEVPVHGLAWVATTADCGKPAALGAAGDPVVPVGTSSRMRSEAFQTLEDILPAKEVAALRQRLWPLARQAMAEATRAQLTNASSRADYDKQCRLTGLADRAIQTLPIADIATAGLDVYVKATNGMTRQWQAVTLDAKRRLVFIPLWANVLLPGVTRGDCPATVRADAWIIDDSGASARRLRSPATPVSRPNVLLRIGDDIYVVNMVDGLADIGLQWTDETASPRLTIEKLTPEGLFRLGYPGYGEGNPRSTESLPVGYAKESSSTKP